MSSSPFAAGTTHFFDPAPWIADAACRGSDTSVFFPARGEEVLDAVAVCRGCPVRAECLEYALNERITFGIWGGTSERERRRIRARRRRQEDAETNPAASSRRPTRRRGAPSGMDILDAVASWHDIPVMDILSRARSPHLITARRHVILIMRDLGATWSAVAGFLDMGISSAQRNASQATEADYEDARRVEQVMANERWARTVAS